MKDAFVNFQQESDINASFVLDLNYFSGQVCTVIMASLLQKFNLKALAFLF
jgi:hypothetical protein